MAGCPGCLLSEKERQALINQLIIKAKADAVRLKKFMVLYNTPDGSVAYMEAEAARAAGITPIQFISHLQPTADGKVSRRTM